jgi:xanthine dehydrogenase large subunit
VTLLERAHEEGAVYGSKAVGEPPLMLAFSVREALRQAAAAFGPEGTSVDLASPATAEAVWWALTEAAKGHERRHVTEGVGVPTRAVRSDSARAPSRVRGVAAHRAKPPGF